MKKFLEIIKNKWLIKGTTTLLLVLIVIACYIGLNMLVEKVNVENLDFTEKKLYSLSDETKTKLSDLNQDVTIQLINATNYRYLIDYAKKYTILNDRIKVEEISDLSSRVDLKTKYNLSDTDMLIVIKEGEKEKTLTSNDLSTYDYSTNKQIDLTEEAITNAIVELSMDKKPVIYVLSSKSYYQSEQALSSVTQKLQDESNEVKYLDILTSGSVPEDCNCLVITTLKEDLNELERDKILEYIKSIIDIFSGIFDVFVSIIVSVYILLQRTTIINALRRFVRAIFKKETYETIDKYFTKANQVFFTFISSQLLDAVIVGILTTIAMMILKVKYAPLIGFTIGLFNMIPYIGAIVAVSIGILVTFITGGFGKALAMAVVVIILQQIDANIINPKIIGSSLEISPLLVIFSITVGGAYFGILGMFLAVPIAVVLKIGLTDFVDARNKIKDEEESRNEG